MGAPLHCYTCAGGGQILENWGKVEPTTLKQTKTQNNSFLLIYYFFCRGCCQNLGIFAIMRNSMTWTSSAMAQAFARCNGQWLLQNQGRLQCCQTQGPKMLSRISLVNIILSNRMVKILHRMTPSIPMKKECSQRRFSLTTCRKLIGQAILIDPLALCHDII